MTRTRMMGLSRRGFGLLTVLVVSTILLASAFMFVSLVTSEGSITKTDSLFKSALSLAESGLAQTVSMMKNGTTPAGVQDSAYWATKLASGSMSIGPVVDSRVHGTFKVALQVMPSTLTSTVTHPDANTTVVQWQGSVELVSTGAIFPQSISAAQMPSSTAYSARRAVRSVSTAYWRTTTTDAVSSQTTLPTYTPDKGFVVKGAIMSGGSVEILSAGGGAEKKGVWNGDVYADGYVYIKKDTGLVNGVAYTHVGFTKGGYIPAGSKGGSEVPAISWPPMYSAQTFRTLFSAYLEGLAPYDGVPIEVLDPLTGLSYSPKKYYPATNTSPTLKDAATGLPLKDPVTGLDVANPYYGSAAYEATVGALKNAATQVGAFPGDTSGTYHLYQLGAGNIPSAAMTDPTAAYYVEAGYVDPTHTGSTVSYQGGNIQGTLFVNGNFSINGGFTAKQGSSYPAVIVMGDVSKDNGHADVYGIFYVNGSANGLLGNASIYGSLISRSTTTALTVSGSYYIDASGVNGAVLPGGGTWSGGGTTTTTTLGVPIYTLDDVRLPGSTERGWQEVSPQ